MAAKKGYAESSRFESGDFLSEYEPYDLLEIDHIIQQTEKATSKVKSPDIKIRHFTLALEKIDLIINNSILVSQRMEQEGTVYDPVEFGIQLDRAKSVRWGLKIKIQELQLAQAEEPDNPSESPIKQTPIIVKTSTPKPNLADGVMDVNGVAEYTKLSVSTIYHYVHNNVIPVSKVGSRLLFVKKDIDEWLESNRKKRE
jgi:excisionase family DNA binding protein